MGESAMPLCRRLFKRAAIPMGDAQMSGNGMFADVAAKATTIGEKAALPELVIGISEKVGELLAGITTCQ